MNPRVEEALSLSSDSLQLRNAAEQRQKREEIIERRLPLSEAVLEFFSAVSGGVLLKHGDIRHDEECYGFIVEDRPFASSVNAVLGIAKSTAAVSYFDEVYPLFRDVSDYEYAWCIDLNDGSQQGQILACEIGYGSHPISDTNVWAQSFEAFLEIVIGDFAAIMRNPREADERRIARLPYPKLDVA